MILTMMMPLTTGALVLVMVQCVLAVVLCVCGHIAILVVDVVYVASCNKLATEDDIRLECLTAMYQSNVRPD